MSTVTPVTFCTNGDWIYARWDLDYPAISPHHINVKEMAAVLVAARRWCETWRDKRVVIHTDSQVVQAMLKGCSSHNQMCMSLLKQLSYLALK